MVHRRRLHGTRQSTPLTGTCLTGTRLKTGIQPCCSGLQVQGTAISPSGATAYSIRSFVRFCKCKECKFVNLSQIGAGFRRKREPRGAGGGEIWYRRYALKRGFGDVSPDGGRGRSPCFTQSPPGRRARRAGRRSRRARRARASAGSASRAELEGGESWCKRHALKRGFGSDEAFPDGLQGQRPCEDLSSAHPKFFPFPIPHTGIRIQHMI